MNVLDLFSGIGGFSLGLERAGMTTVAFCEIDPYCRAVLRKHWPKVPQYDDVRTLTADTLRRDGIAVDVICGGFPCQDVSFAGKRAGLEGARSGLWTEYARLIGELRPGFVIVENVPGLLSLGMGAVLGDLSALGYDATWDCVPASAVGAPHRRDRVWVIAYANRWRAHAEPEYGRDGESSSDTCRHGSQSDVADTSSKRRREARQHREQPTERAARYGDPLANTDGTRLEVGQRRVEGQERARQPATISGGWWLVEPDVGRVASGISNRVDRLRALGNAVVPQIPEIIGRAIMTTPTARPVSRSGGE